MKQDDDDSSQIDNELLFDERAKKNRLYWKGGVIFYEKTDTLISATYFY